MNFYSKYFFYHNVYIIQFIAAINIYNNDIVQ